MVRTNVNLWRNVDWITITIYLLLVIAGWFSVCGASYNYGDFDFFSFDSRAGKQLVWIGCSLGLGFVLLMLEEKLYDMFSYVLYALMMVLLFITPFLAEDTKGSYSWIKFGPVSLQPAEFAKFATSLALAKFISSYNFYIDKNKHFAAVIAMILLPMFLIVMQRETGSALVYLAFFFMLYREGMPGSILFIGICAVLYFVVGIKFSTEFLPDGYTVIGEFTVLSLIIMFTSLLIKIYCNKTSIALYIFFSCALIIGIALFVSSYYPFDVTLVQYGISVILVFYLLFLALRDRMKNYFYIALFAIGSIGFLYSAEYLFNDLLEPHQQIRIKVVLGMEEDLTGAGYNVNQSKIAIGSGGILGKGFLNGTQTKLKYVPEQDTDFIFCTIGEEQGFVGSAAVLLLFMILILRLISLSERQHSRFSRVYGYCVLSILLFHMFINIGMVIGLAPVIGIPLPFFSYGGSSLWGFTILLFVFLRMDAARKRI